MTLIKAGYANRLLKNHVTQVGHPVSFGSDVLFSKAHVEVTTRQSRQLPLF